MEVKQIITPVIQGLSQEICEKVIKIWKNTNSEKSQSSNRTSIHTKSL